jgi:hypothetical protein
MPTDRTRRLHPITPEALRAHARYWHGKTRDLLEQAADKIERLNSDFAQARDLGYCAAIEDVTTAQAERDALKAEIERLRSDVWLARDAALQQAEEAVNARTVACFDGQGVRVGDIQAAIRALRRQQGSPTEVAADA